MKVKKVKKVDRIGDLDIFVPTLDEGPEGSDVGTLKPTETETTKKQTDTSAEKKGGVHRISLDDD